jgi:hypothetical protein
MKHRWVLLWLGLCFIGIFLPLRLDAAGIQIVTAVGYNGYIIPEHWVPLQIQLKGMNEPSARIEIIREEPIHQAPAESFRLRGVNRVEFPVFAAENIKSLKVRVLAGDQLLAEQVLDMKSKIFPGHLVLTANVPDAETQAIERSLLPIEPVMAVPVNIHELPNLGLNYDGVSCLVLNDPEPVLTPAQLKALRYWLAGGGKLLVFGAGQDMMKMMAAMGVKRDDLANAPLMNAPDISMGLGKIRIIPNRLPEAIAGENSSIWRRWLALKPYRETVRLTASHCFFNESWGQTETTAAYPFPAMAIIFTIWTGAALFFIWRRPKNLLACFLVFTLISAILMLPLTGYLTAHWRRGALIHNRAVILPDSGGVLLAANIQMKPSQGASPWGAVIDRGRDEHGFINYGGRRHTAWNHRTAYPWYSIYAGNETRLNLMGVFPDWNPVRRRLPDREKWSMPVTGQTVSWDGKQWRVLKKAKNGQWRWVNGTDAPAWLKSDEDWLRKLQSLSPEIAWLYGRGVLPARFQLRIQTGAVPEFSWAMPDLKQFSKR